MTKITNVLIAVTFGFVRCQKFDAKLE